MQSIVRTKSFVTKPAQKPVTSVNFGSLPAGWWLAPAALFGAIGWVGLAVVVVAVVMN